MVLRCQTVTCVVTYVDDLPLKFLSWGMRRGPVGRVATFWVGVISVRQLAKEILRKGISNCRRVCT